MLCFFGYCALESTAGLWAASYLTLARDIPAETAAGFAALFYLGITAGRAVSGWIAPHLGDDGMIRLGLWGIAWVWQPCCCRGLRRSLLQGW